MILAAFLEGFIAALLLIVPFWKIYQKAGLTPAWSLLLFAPVIGVMSVIFVLAFRKWPDTEGKG